MVTTATAAAECLSTARRLIGVASAEAPERNALICPSVELPGGRSDQRFREAAVIKTAATYFYAAVMRMAVKCVTRGRVQAANGDHNYPRLCVYGDGGMCLAGLHPWPGAATMQTSWRCMSLAHASPALRAERSVSLARYRTAMPNGSVSGSSRRAICNRSGAARRAWSAAARAWSGLWNAPTWMAQSPRPAPALEATAGKIVLGAAGRAGPAA